MTMTILHTTRYIQSGNQISVGQLLFILQNMNRILSILNSIIPTRYKANSLLKWYRFHANENND